MAYILIDGYNLIGIAHTNLEKARNDIIEKLSRYSKLRGHDITIVFDGWKSGQATATKLQIGNVYIIYSRLGEKADFVIKNILSEKQQKNWIVVSSDREISDFADKRDFVSLKSDEFEGRLYSSFYSAEDEKIDDSDEDVMTVRQKGNPRRLSKKMIRKLRALEKL